MEHPSRLLMDLHLRISALSAPTSASAITSTARGATLPRLLLVPAGFAALGWHGKPLLLVESLLACGKHKLRTAVLAGQNLIVSRTLVVFHHCSLPVFQPPPDLLQFHGADWILAHPKPGGARPAPVPIPC
jgi:hypothetical protein